LPASEKLKGSYYERQDEDERSYETPKFLHDMLFLFQNGKFFYYCRYYPNLIMLQKYKIFWIYKEKM